MIGESRGQRALGNRDETEPDPHPVESLRPREQRLRLQRARVIEGRGHQLRGDLERIVAVCDAFDAMTTDRPYRARLDAGAALAELEGGPDNPLETAGQLLAAAIDHATALGVATLYARPQGLDRVWVRFGFIPVPEVALPPALAGRTGAGLYAWRGGSALWTLREAAAE